MFSLLAVTYVVLSGNSRDASRAVLRGERQFNFDLDATGRNVVTSLIAGTTNQQSPFYQNDLLGDIYSRDSFVTRFHVFDSTASWQLMDSPAIDATSHKLPPFCFVKLTLNPVAENGFQLSQFENEYNSRIVTVLEGPLTGQSFRIVKYVGHVNPNTDPSPIAALPVNDPNVDLTPWSRKNYVDPNGVQTAYSIVIDLNEIRGERFTGSYFPPSSLEEKSITLSVIEWIKQRGVQSLFYKPLPTGAPIASYQGFRLMINGAPFNSVGIGIEEVAELPPLSQPFISGFGNIDSKRLMRIPSLQARKVSPALLPHYDYLSDPVLMERNPLLGGDPGVDGIGTPRSNPREYKLRGQSNEGYDVADYRDHWLANITHVNTSPGNWEKWIKPSYHQPAVIQYIANLFGNPDDLMPGEVDELLRVIDASTSRVLSYRGRNPSFMANVPGYPRIPENFTWSSPPTPIEVETLRSYVRSQITGRWGLPSGTENRWDVDNDGDSQGDAVWMDPGLAVVFGPEGQRLKPLVAITTIDLDGRVNVNAAGERLEALNSMFPESNNYFKQDGARLVPTGFGYGPKEISLARLFSGLATGPVRATDVNPILSSDVGTRYSFFDELYGMRRSPIFGRMPLDFTSVFADRSPGRRNTDDNELASRHRENFSGNRTLPGLPIGRRGAIGLSFDKLGNPAFIVRSSQDANPINPNQDAFPNETIDDGYEFAAMGRPISDDPLSLADLEALLRRFDSDTNSLPTRLRDVLRKSGFSDVNNHIYDAITTRSAELRYPNLGAVLANGTGENRQAYHETPSLLKYLQWLHSQRYRLRVPDTESNSATRSDPEISYAALTELFSSEFAAGLRMDLNRPFGDGYDTDGLGLTDDPLELSTAPQLEDPFGVPTVGAYSREIYSSATKAGSPATPFVTTTRGRLGSRQILARHLYCLAQLIVPKQHEFPEMRDLETNVTSVTERNFRRAEIRARAIAQWAINVVDFRDADATMTRFEYDIFPFGLGADNATATGLSPRPAYWAPDHIGESVEGVPNKRYVRVVWGMELPELVLSETLAFHDKRVRDTDMDASGELTAISGGTDPTFDQYRFPQASLFIELKAVRTAENTAVSTPGVSRLHKLVDGEMHLDLGAMAPASGAWGSQPVWRIAISQDYDLAGVDASQRPLIESDTSVSPPVGVTLSQTMATHQFAFELTNGASAALGNPNLADSTTVEEYIGSGLIYNPATGDVTPPQLQGFERFVWFTTSNPTGNIPDILPSIRLAGTDWQAASVYRARLGSLSDNSNLLRGGEFLVVAPRLETPIGSLTHHPFEGNLYPSALRMADLSSDPRNRPVHAPSRQRISLTPVATRPFQFPPISGNRTVRTYSINDSEINQEWWIRSRLPKALVCAVPPPDDPSEDNYVIVQSGRDWDLPFPNGIGVNITYPTPVHSDTYATTEYWHPSHRPVVRLNSLDKLGGGTPEPRPDDTLGFGNDDYLRTNPNGAFLPPDSWVDTAVPTRNFPDEPFDLNNPFIGGAGRNRSQSYENVRTAYLQRLADPDFAYDPTSNPYITIDWMPIDLTVFNGEAASMDDPRDGGNLTGGQWSFQARYKDGRLTPTIADNGGLGPQSGISVYAPHTPAPRTSVPQSPPASAPPSAEYPAGLNYQAHFTHVLGYDAAINWGIIPQASGTTLGYSNVGFHEGNTLLAVTAVTNLNVDGFGPPQNSGVAAFQGHTRNLQGLLWTNRPFSSPYEIMMVPATSAGSFGTYHSTFRGNERTPFAFLPSFQACNAWNIDYPLNHSKSYWGIPERVGTNGPRDVFEGDWSLLLDFIETKPPFIDAEKILNPATVYQNLGFGGTPPAWAPIANRFLNSFIPQGYYGSVSTTPSPSRVRGPTVLAPFNSLPTFVNSGKINLNTITIGPDGRSKALESLEQHYLRGTDVASWFNLFRSGYDTTAGGTAMTNRFFGSKILHFNPNLPTDFVGAFRPSITSNIAPALHDPSWTALMRNRWNAQTGLMRAANVAASLNINPPVEVPVFNSRPEAHGLNTAEGRETFDAQPFLRYQRIMRLPNLATNQSNIFASWVTISLFEYDPITGFGNQYISPSGSPITEKYFYIIDRTVPVGYSSGERLNTERTILLEKKL